MHLFAASCVCPDRRLNTRPGCLALHSNQLSHQARTCCFPLYLTLPHPLILWLPSKTSNPLALTLFHYPSPYQAPCSRASLPSSHPMVHYYDNTFNPPVIHLTFTAKPQPWLNQLPVYSAPTSEQLEKISPLCVLVFSSRPLILKWGPQGTALQSNHIPLSVCPTSLSDSYFKPRPTLQMDSSLYPFLAEVESSWLALECCFCISAGPCLSTSHNSVRSFPHSWHWKMSVLVT